MRIAILGYGKMGRSIEEILLERGHEIVLKADGNHQATKDDLKNIDVAIEFSNPNAAYHNISLCFDNHIPVVSGTTGWLDKKDKIASLCNQHHGTFFYASNYSIGVNLFFKLNL